jgi:hypothetical protein
MSARNCGECLVGAPLLVLAAPVLRHKDSVLRVTQMLITVSARAKHMLRLYSPSLQSPP